jgi:hypothetical protein
MSSWAAKIIAILVALAAVEEALTKVLTNTPTLIQRAAEFSRLYNPDDSPTSPDPRTPPAKCELGNIHNQFDDEAQAKGACPQGNVVWLNTYSGVYHLPGTRWYGRTKSGKYVCPKEADDAGCRQSKTNQ